MNDVCNKTLLAFSTRLYVINHCVIRIITSSKNRIKTNKRGRAEPERIIVDWQVFLPSQ